MNDDVIALMEQAWNLLRSGERDRAEQLFLLASEKAPDDADPLNGLGAVYFERGELGQALEYYLKARDLARKAYGDAGFPERISWDLEGKPALRAMHGVGLALFRLGRTEEAERVFRDLLGHNPDDNQGVGYLLKDIAEGKDPWKESAKDGDEDDDDDEDGGGADPYDGV